MMKATQNLGAVQMQAAVKSRMDDVQAQVDAIHQSGANEVEQRKQILQYQSKALMQVSALGGNKEQLAAIQNLMPPIPETANAAMLHGQMMGDKTMFAAGKNVVDMEQKNKLQIIGEEARVHEKMERMKTDDATIKSFKQDAYKGIAANKDVLNLNAKVKDDLGKAFDDMGAAYDPQSKTLTNKETGEILDVSTPELRDQALKKATEWNSGVQTGPTSIFSKIFGDYTDNGSQTSTHAARLNTIAQNLMLSKQKMIGARAMSQDNAREFYLNNKASPYHGKSAQLSRLMDNADDAHQDYASATGLVNKWGKALSTNSRDPSDYSLNLNDFDQSAMIPAGPQQMPGLAPKASSSTGVPGLILKKR